jgi:hypothetical protein
VRRLDTGSAFLCVDAKSGGWRVDGEFASFGAGSTTPMRLGATTSLVAIPTANVWEKTNLLLLSLASARDRCTPSPLHSRNGLHI